MSRTANFDNDECRCTIREQKRLVECEESETICDELVDEENIFGMNLVLETVTANLPTTSTVSESHSFNELNNVKSTPVSNQSRVSKKQKVNDYLSSLHCSTPTYDSDSSGSYLSSPKSVNIASCRLPARRACSRVTIIIWFH